MIIMIIMMNWDQSAPQYDPSDGETIDEMGR